MVTDEELLARLPDEEDALVERKPGPDRRQIREAVCAFANSVRAPATGVLFLGVDTKGKANGKISDPDKLGREIPGWLTRCYPLIAGTEVHALRVDGEQVVAVVVPESRDRPHFTGPAFVRDGSQTREANGEQFQKLIEDRSDIVWALRPFIGRPVATEVEGCVHTGARIWRNRQLDCVLMDVDQHFVTAKRADQRMTFSLGRIYLEHDVQADQPVLRVRLG